MVLYVGLSLYTEFASGSTRVEKAGTWTAPVSKKREMQAISALYDTNLVGYGSMRGCLSRKSRMEMHRLWEAIVSRTAVSATDNAVLYYNPDNVTQRATFTEGRSILHIMDNGSHLLFAKPHFGSTFPVGTLDNERACLEDRAGRLSCFSKSSNISVIGLVGNILYFEANYEVVAGDSRPLLSNDAFEVDGPDKKIMARDAAAANARRRDDFIKYEGNIFRRFRFKFKYASIESGSICDEKPQIEPHMLRMPQNAKPLFEERPSSGWVPWIKFPEKTARFIGLFANDGLFGNKLRDTVEMRNSTMACCQFIVLTCASKYADGTIELSLGQCCAVRVERWVDRRCNLGDW